MLPLFYWFFNPLLLLCCCPQTIILDMQGLSPMKHFTLTVQRFLHTLSTIDQVRGAPAHHTLPAHEPPSSCCLQAWCLLKRAHDTVHRHHQHSMPAGNSRHRVTGWLPPLTLLLLLLLLGDCCFFPTKRTTFRSTLAACS